MQHRFDVIGDVHGQLGGLRALGVHLGYDVDRGWAHPEGRALVFLGDLIDRGEDSLGVAELVMSLVHEGRALCLLGNHEYNLVGHALGIEAAKHSNRATIADMLARPERWAPVIDFFRTLPMAIELPELRIVHAVWHLPSFAQLEPVLRPPAAASSGITTTDWLQQHVVLGSPFARSGLLAELAMHATSDVGEDEAHEVMIKGHEGPSEPFIDSDGKERSRIRVTWWQGARAEVAADRRIVFGHYWNLPPIAGRSSHHAPPHPSGHPLLKEWLRQLAEHVPARGFSEVPAGETFVCIDYNGVFDAGQGSCIGAYRWPEGRVAWARARADGDDDDDDNDGDSDDEDDDSVSDDLDDWDDGPDGYPEDEYDDDEAAAGGVTYEDALEGVVDVDVAAAGASSADRLSGQEVGRTLADVERDVAAAPGECFSVDADGMISLRAGERVYQAGRFSTPTLGELRARLAGRASGGKLRLSALLGENALTDIGSLQAAAEPGVMFQVASQFNCLEAPSPHLVPVRSYVTDPTQGPRASVSAFPGTFLRHYRAPSGDGDSFIQCASRQINLLEDALDGEADAVRHGYLSPRTIRDPNQLAQLLEDRFERIRVGVHDDVEVVFGHNWGGPVVASCKQRVAQLFTSTIALGGYGSDDGSPALATIRRQLLRGAYLGTLLAALDLGKHAVVLTLIGGGVFGNRHRDIADAIQWAIEQAQPLAPRALHVLINARALDRSLASRELEDIVGRHDGVFADRPRRRA